MKASLSTLIRLVTPEGIEIHIRPELVAAVVLGPSSEVILSNYQTAHKCTQESALRVIEAVRAGGPLVTIPPQPKGPVLS